MQNEFVGGASASSATVSQPEIVRAEEPVAVETPTPLDERENMEAIGQQLAAEEEKEWAEAKQASDFEALYTAERLAHEVTKASLVYTQGQLAAAQASLAMAKEMGFSFGQIHRGA